jgi:putative oxidoreductase
MSIRAFVIARPSSGDTATGLLILRVFAGLSLFLNHGWEKLTRYSIMVQHFPDPIHIGAHASLAFALLSDGICSVLVILGLATRPATIIILINLLTVFFFMDHAVFFSHFGDGQLVWVYIAAFAAVLIAGPGRLSIDAYLRR